MSLENKLTDIAGEIQKLQITSSKAIEARERLDAQLQENELVQKVRNAMLPADVI
jgi:prefoldin beta subunit